jgi:hypothetical protein
MPTHTSPHHQISFDHDHIPLANCNAIRAQRILCTPCLADSPRGYSLSRKRVEQALC